MDSVPNGQRAADTRLDRLPPNRNADQPSAAPVEAGTSDFAEELARLAVMALTAEGGHSDNGKIGFGVSIASSSCDD